MKDKLLHLINKKRLIVILIIVSIVLLTVFGLSYAFSDILVGAELLFEETNDNYILDVYKKGNYSLSLNSKNQSASAVVSLEAKNNKSIKCTYDIALVWDSENAYIKKTADNKQLTIKNNLMDEIDLSYFQWHMNQDSKYEAVILSSSIYSTNSAKNIKEYKFDATMYNNGFDNNQKFEGHFTITNIECTEVNINEDFATFLLYNSSDENKISSQDGVYKLVNQVVKYKGTNINVGLRYQGTDPDNYILFNDELYRIVGVFGENDHGISNANLIKIVRFEPIQEAKFDDISNAFEGSYIDTLLNTNYYNTLNNESKKLIQTARYYMGESSSSDMPIEIYNNEKNKYSEKNIGLIYYSDYAFAMLPSNDACQINTVPASNDYANNGCDNFNYLASMDIVYWTMSPNKDGNVRYIMPGGGEIAMERNVSSNWGVKPAFYLKEGVKYKSGSGSLDDPYIIQ